MEKKNEGIYDGFKELGTGKMMVLGIQHVFAMFGATVLVPILSGLDISVTLFAAGIATLWFFFITKRKVPIFLGSSFAFLGAYASVAADDPNRLALIGGGVVAAGLLYVIFAALFGIFGAKRVMKLFPPVVTGPIIILIGLTLAGSAINNASQNWILAAITIIIVICVNLFGKGMIKILPILCAVFGAFAIGLIVHLISPNLFGLTWLNADPWINAFGPEATVGISTFVDVPPFHLPQFDFSICLTFIIVAIAAMVEHIGDICAIGATCGKNFIKDPGLTRTLLGDGIGTSLAGLIGGPANTTYSENTGVVALTKVYDPKVMFIAACFSIVLSFVAIFKTFIQMIPNAIIGGISIVLYGMISATGIRTIIEHKVNYANMRNVIITALIMVLGLGIQYSHAMGLTVLFGDAGIAYNTLNGAVKIGSVQFGGLACAAIVGILANILIPGKDYNFDMEDGDTKETDPAPQQ